MSDAKFQWAGEPMPHQINAARKAWHKSAFAFFHEMGTGKTYSSLHLAKFRFIAGQITHLLVICPSSIKLVWEKELKEWLDLEYKAFVMKAGKKALPNWCHDEDYSGLKIMIAGVEALSIGGAYDLCLKFTHRQKTMCVVDESIEIKDIKAKKTKRAIQIGKTCDYRIILNGTSITESLENLFGQFAYLSTDIIGCGTSLVLFRNRYCVMGGFEGRQIIGYKNKEELLNLIAPYVDIVLKEEALELPDKVYETIVVEPTKEQNKVLEQLKDTFMAEQEGKELIADTILSRLTRYQQVIGGFFPYLEEDTLLPATVPIKGENPKLKATLDLISRIPADAKIIIWARFRPEVAAIVEALEGTVEFHGGVSDEGKKEAVRSFQEGDARFFVATLASGARGLTLTAGTYVIYYSNSFSNYLRRQSEDRCHRKGQTNKVTYFDIQMNLLADKMIFAALTKKQDLAKYVETNLKTLTEELGA